MNGCRRYRTSRYLYPLAGQYGLVTAERVCGTAARHVSWCVTGACCHARPPSARRQEPCRRIGSQQSETPPLDRCAHYRNPWCELVARCEFCGVRFDDNRIRSRHKSHGARGCEVDEGIVDLVDEQEAWERLPMVNLSTVDFTHRRYHIFLPVEAISCWRQKPGVDLFGSATAGARAKQIRRSSTCSRRRRGGHRCVPTVGAHTIYEELDAMRRIGVNAAQALLVRRMLACRSEAVRGFISLMPAETRSGGVR